MILWIVVFVHILWTWILAIRRAWQARRIADSPNLQVPGYQPPVSILVPAWKEKGTLEGCIEALKRIEYPGWEALILAGGPDGTYEAALLAAAGDSRFRVLKRGPEPKNVAIAQGVQAARHDILVLLDADSIVNRYWLTRLVEPIASGAAASFGMHYPSKETWISLTEIMEVIQAYQILKTRMAQGCSSQAIRRSVLNRIGPLPADAYSWEDWDIDVRLMDAGETNVFAPNALLFTDRPTTFREYWQNAVRCYRSHLVGLWQYREMLLRRPAWGFLEILFYLISFALTIIIICSLTLAILRPELIPAILQINLLGVIWIGGRRIALAAEVAAFKSDSSWLWRGWSLVALMPVQFVAAVVAVLGVWKQTRFDYKGRR